MAPKKKAAPKKRPRPDDANQSAFRAIQGVIARTEKSAPKRPVR